MNEKERRIVREEAAKLRARAEAAETLAEWRTTQLKMANDAASRVRDAMIVAQADAIRLREARTLLSKVYNALGYTWPQSFVEDVGAFLETSGKDAAAGKALDENEKLQAEVERLRTELAELSALHMALVEQTGDW